MTVAIPGTSTPASADRGCTPASFPARPHRGVCRRPTANPMHGANRSSAARGGHERSGRWSDRRIVRTHRAGAPRPDLTAGGGTLRCAQGWARRLTKMTLVAYRLPSGSSRSVEVSGGTWSTTTVHWYRRGHLRRIAEKGRGAADLFARHQTGCSSTTMPRLWRPPAHSVRA